MDVTQIETLKALSNELLKINTMIDYKHEMILEYSTRKNIEYIFMGQLKIKIIKCMIDTSFHCLVDGEHINYGENDFILKSIQYIKNDKNSDEHFANEIIQNFVFGTFSIFENTISNIFSHLLNEEEITDIQYSNIDKLVKKINKKYNIMSDRVDYKKTLNKQISLPDKIKYIANKLSKNITDDTKKFITLTSCLRNSMSHSNTISNVDIDFKFKGYHYLIKKGEPCELFVESLADIVKEYYNIIEYLNPGGEIQDLYQEFT